jgi:hypothetical protein
MLQKFIFGQFKEGNQHLPNVGSETSFCQELEGQLGGLAAGTHQNEAEPIFLVPRQS